MVRIPQFAAYRHQLMWMAERDKLEAAFCKLGSGFVTPFMIKEAKESIEKINQILTNYPLGQTRSPIPIVYTQDSKSNHQSACQNAHKCVDQEGVCNR